MKDNYKSNFWVKNLQSSSFVNRPVLFFVIFFLMFLFSGEVVGQNPELINPIFTHIDQKDRGNASVGTEANITVAVDSDSKGNVYILTFGNGVFKYNPKTDTFSKIITDELGDKGNLNSPLDLAVDNNDIIYIADGGSKLIKKYSTSGIFINSIGSGSGGNGKDELWEPTGIEFDNENNLYIVDAYRGTNTEITKKYFLKIYYADGRFKSFQGTTEHPIINPYRVAANDKYIFISHSSNNGEVVVFNKDFTYKTTLPNIGSPGSLFIDDFGYLYVVDYSNRLNFSQIFKIIKGDGNILEYYSIYSQIQQGISESEFKVQIFDSYLNQIPGINEVKNPPAGKDYLQLPLDVSLNHCDKLYLLDANIPALATLNFDLEIYKRTPSFDTEKPVKITCPTDQNATLTNGSFKLLDYTNLVEFSDNCDSELELIQDPPKDFPITSTQLVTITAKDDAGNISESCQFKVIINEPSNSAPVANNDSYNTNQNTPLSISAPGVLANDTDTDEDELSVSIQNPTSNGSIVLNANGSFTYTPNNGYVGPDSFTYVANDGTVNSNIATVNINVLKVNSAPVANNDSYSTNQNTPLSISAPGVFANDTDPDEDQLSVSIQAPTSNGSIVLNANGSFTYTPNNGYVGPDSFTYVANDGTVNSNVATVNITVNPVAATPTFNCPDPSRVTILPLDQNCDFDTPDYSGKITNFQNFKKQPYFIQTEARSGNTLNITIEVYDGQNGDFVGKCEFSVTLQDQMPANVICLSDIKVPYSNTKSFTLEDYRDQLTISDNCSTTFDIQQTPAPGIVISEDTQITFIVKDGNDNQSGCNFNIEFYKDTELQILNCPGDQTFEVDEDCAYLIPDIASNIETNIEGATITQNITADFEVHGNLTLTITAKFEDQVDTCEVKLIAKDSIDPVIECPGDQDERVEAGEGFPLPNYILNATYDDNCYVAELKQQPDVGTVIFETTEVTLTAIDAFGNFDTCTFMVNISENNPDLEIKCPGLQSENLDENCQFIVPDYTSQSQVNFEATVTQSPLPGTVISSDTDITLTARGDKGTTTCMFKVKVVDTTAPEANCVGVIDLRLNANGIATLNADNLDDNSFDACGIISKSISKSTFSTSDLGENTVILTVFDAADNSDSCETLVNILPYDANVPDFECKESIVIQLDEKGEAQISPEDLYTGNGTGYQFSVDKTDFTCDNIGSNNVLLSYSGNNSQGSCSVEVFVEDLIGPVVRTKNISITLDENGRASITPEMLDNGTTDNCGDVRLLLDQTDFNCDDLGENRILLRAQDESSNLGSAYAIVTVLGECETSPTPTGPGYIFIYPNPTDGPFSYYLPDGISLNKVEVYDMQGKYIMTREFDATIAKHEMDLTGLQQAVYVLKLFTSEGEKILRVIVY